MVKKHTFYIDGMQCGACKILIEQKLNSVEGVADVMINLNQKTVELSLTSQYTNLKWLDILNTNLSHYNYQLTHQVEPKENDDLWFALPIGLSLLLLFVYVQKMGWLHFDLSLVNEPFSSWFVGLIASLSGCLVVVGGFILSLSAEQTNFSVSRKTIYSFHSGRLAGFFVLGAALGGFGQLIDINFTFSVLVGILASCMMLFMGFRLVGFPSFSFPYLSKLFSLYRYVKQPSFPFLLGVATFFLPCGFAQSMQLMALSSGSWYTGALIMLFFALGTLPVLLLISFGGFAIVRSKRSAVFLKVLGVIVIGFGLLTFLMGLISLKVLPPVLDF